MTNFNNVNTNFNLLNNNFSNNFSNTGTANNYSGVNLSDYSSIKNGSYGKLLKSYYAKQETGSTKTDKESSAKISLAKSNADELKKSADALNRSSLWEKKTFTQKDEVTGEETEKEDYDWDNILKAVKSYVSDYNNVVDDAAESNSKTILRNGMWMTNMTSRNTGLLNEVGISVGKGNKLEVDESKLKEARITSLKTLFTGYHSYGNKVSQKASSIGAATVGQSVKSNVSYTDNGSYAKSLSELLPKEVDESL